MPLASPTRLTALVGAGLTAFLLAGCGNDAGDRPVDGLPTVPAGPGTVSMTDPAYAVGAVVHVGGETIAFPRRVEAWVRAQGRVWALLRDGIWSSDGGEPRPTGYDSGSLYSSASGDLLGVLDSAHGARLSSVVLDLTTGLPVVRDPAGMGDVSDDLPDLYEDAEPRALGFEAETFLVKGADNHLYAFGSSGERTDLGDDYLFPPGGEPRVATFVDVVLRGGRAIEPAAPQRAERRALRSPDGTVTVVDDPRRTTFHDSASGAALPVDLGAERFILGGWPEPRTAYGIRFDGNQPGRGTELVTCPVPSPGARQPGRCEVVEQAPTPGHTQVLFATGARDLY